MILLEGMEEALVRVRKYLTEFPHKILHFLPVCIAVRRTGRFDDRQVQHFCHMFHMALRQVNEGTDHGDAGPAHTGFRVEGFKPPFIKQRHEQGFNGVLAMMSQGKLVDIVFHTGVGKDRAAHFRTERAGVLFLTVVKDDFADFRFLHNILNIQLFTQGADTGEIKRFQSEGDGNGIKRKILMGNCR